MVRLLFSLLVKILWPVSDTHTHIYIYIERERERGRRERVILCSWPHSLQLAVCDIRSIFGQNWFWNHKFPSPRVVAVQKPRLPYYLPITYPDYITNLFIIKRRRNIKEHKHELKCKRPRPGSNFSWWFYFLRF